MARMNTMNAILIAAAILIIAAAAGCSQFLAHTSSQFPTRAGSHVRLEQNENMIAGCKPRGSLIGKGTLGVTNAQKLDAALNEIKNAASLRGADTVLIVSMDTMYPGTVIRGVAYDCPPRLVIRSPF